MISKMIIFAVLIVAVFGVLFLFKQTTKPVLAPAVQTATPTPKQSALLDYGEQKLSVNQISVKELGNSTNSAQFTAKMTEHVLSPSGNLAAAVIIDSPGGSGIFYYLVGGMVKNGEQITSTPKSLGDRIKIVTVKVDDPGTNDNGMITIDYLDRTSKSPMSDEPTINMYKKYAFQENGDLIEVLH